MPSPVFIGLSDAGVPLNGGKLYTYTAGTVTPLATWTDSALTVANANPVVLSSAGRATVYLSPVSYKFVLKTSADVTVWTQDEIQAVPVTNVDLDIQGTAGEALVAGDVVYLSAGDGGRTAGRFYLADADNNYSSTTANAIGMIPADIASGESGSIRLVGRVTGLSSLTAGTVYYVSATAGDLTSSAPANARAVAVADSTTSVVMSQWIPISDASATLPGKVSTGTQTFAGVKTFSSAIVFGALPTGIGSSLLGRVATAVTVNNSTTLVNATGMAFAIGANETWVFNAALHGICAAAADWKIAVTAPTSPTGIRYGVVGHGGASGTGSTATAGTGVEQDASGNEETVLLSGIIRNGANSGSIQVQFAQLTANVSDCIVRADSYIVGQRLA
jgi:hypothetical protein